jgi:hypothetical protein
MAFQKVGSPQPLEVVNDICQECNVNKAEFHIDGKFVCGSCKMKLEEEKQPKEEKQNE